MLTNNCPHCGTTGNWYYRNSYLSKGGKKLIEVSYCPKCNWRFIEEYKLHPVTHNGKLKTTTEHKLSKWQLFCADGLKQGKTLKELSQLYWHERQTNNQLPTSVASITSKGE
jgi:hypothetical protein